MEHSDSESDTSSFVEDLDEFMQRMWTCNIEEMEFINQGLLEIEKNLKDIVTQAGPMEGQLNALLLSLPKQPINLPTETAHNNTTQDETDQTSE